MTVSMTSQEQKAWLEAYIDGVETRKVTDGQFVSDFKCDRYRFVDISTGHVRQGAAGYGATAEDSITGLFNAVTQHGPGKHLLLQRDRSVTRVVIDPASLAIRPFQR